MAALGKICLLLALVVCVYGIGASLYGARRSRAEFSISGRRAVYALAGILTVAMAVIEVAFLRNDFSFNTVANTSSRTTPALYRAAAVWSSQEGDLENGHRDGEDPGERVDGPASGYGELRAAPPRSV